MDLEQRIHAVAIVWRVNCRHHAPKRLLQTGRFSGGTDKMKRLRTDRLVLRALEETDGEAFYEVFSDPETMRYWSGTPVGDQAEAQALLRREFALLDGGDCQTWAVALPDSDRLIGKISLFGISGQNRRAEIGYILRRDQWGRGLMSEALAVVLDHAFDEVGLHRIEADTDPANRPSLALLEKFGFRREGLFRDRWCIGGRWHDSAMLGLLEEDYRTRRAV
jgi:RimJ/RimL family protein N-acetyltransferase